MTLNFLFYFYITIIIIIINANNDRFAVYATGTFQRVLEIHLESVCSGREGKSESGGVPVTVINIDGLTLSQL